MASVVYGFKSGAWREELAEENMDAEVENGMSGLVDWVVNRTRGDETRSIDGGVHLLETHRNNMSQSTKKVAPSNPHGNITEKIEKV